MADSDFAMLREAAEHAITQAPNPRGVAGGRSFLVDAGLVLSLLQQRDELVGVLRELNRHLERLAELGWPGPAHLIESTLTRIDGAT
jgi:hypothetical protein